jgi:ubiquinone/menaquinone biosynthesis C-methylase UbiE
LAFGNIPLLSTFKLIAVMSQQNQDYILGTEDQELKRLGVQHEVWSSEASEGWRLAGFKKGDTLLDLGCGPGYCTMELAHIAGDTGKVIAIDKSEKYIAFLNGLNAYYHLNIETHASDFETLVLPSNSLDGVYSRWALAWTPKYESIVANIARALRPGGKFVAHEYYDWSSFKTEPALPHLKNGIAKALQSFEDTDSNIHIGRKMPSIFAKAGLEVVSIRPMSKIATPKSQSWNWPTGFLKIYFPKLVEMGLITHQEEQAAQQDLIELSQIAQATIYCPQMVEVIGMKKIV